MIAGPPGGRGRALRIYGDALGIAFQIVDDLLDVAGDAAVTGKNVGDDFRDRKLTLPVIKAVAKADADEARLLGAHDREGRPERRRPDNALDLLARHGAIEETRAEALAWATQAKDALAPLPEHPLQAIARATWPTTSWPDRLRRPRPDTRSIH